MGARAARSKDGERNRGADHKHITERNQTLSTANKEGVRGDKVAKLGIAGAGEGSGGTGGLNSSTSQKGGRP